MAYDYTPMKFGKYKSISFDHKFTAILDFGNDKKGWIHIHWLHTVVWYFWYSMVPTSNGVSWACVGICIIWQNGEDITRANRLGLPRYNS